jgi:hypothetical protein
MAEASLNSAIEFPGASHEADNPRDSFVVRAKG